MNEMNRSIRENERRRNEVKELRFYKEKGTITKRQTNRLEFLESEGY